MAQYDGKVTLSTALDNSGLVKGLKGVVGTLGGLAKVTARVTGVITAAFGAAAVAITKQAVDAYADYEQLAGGVETLFKDSAEKVKQYANDAFFTVGISANEYMSMVTSFSASLISSLGGDTEKAADIANMALVDMADNANKMGSTLESVQNAYQGFSKGQYQLLDNLKLGYGGSKTEMERLLADAQKLTGVKYNINNLSDVYSAIHAIQEELGIAGTTAKEAEGTITGSAAMTKAAWQNVLTAIAGGGDLDRAINNLVYSVSKYFDNIVPVVERSLAGIGQLIERIAPQLVQTVAASLIRAIPSLLNAVYQMIIGLAQGIAQGIKALFTGGEIKPVNKQLESVADGFESASAGADDLAASTEKAGKAAKKYLAGFDEITKISKESGSASGTTSTGIGSSVTSGGGSLDLAGDVAGVTVSPFIDSILGSIGSGDWESVGLLIAEKINGAIGLINWESAGQTLSGVFVGFLELLNGVIMGTDWQQIGTGIATFIGSIDWTSLVSALSQGIGAALAGIGKLIIGFLTPAWNSVVEWWRDVAFEDGKFTMEGLLLGITLVFRDIYSWIGNKIVKPFLDGIKSLFGIHSPSTVMEEIGGYLAEGFTNGFEKVTDMIKGCINGVIGFINSMITAVCEGINFVITSLNKLSFEIPDWVPVVGGQEWGFNIGKITPPQIPLLAKGAVIPPNAPFMAVLGDQRHGTNIEAPLSTIQEAVALVMDDQISAALTVAEEIIARQDKILATIESIEIGDTTIGEAADRYNHRMRIVRGEI